MLDNLLDIEVAYSLLRGGAEDDEKDPIDINYEKLRTKIEVCFLLFQTCESPSCVPRELGCVVMVMNCVCRWWITRQKKLRLFDSTWRTHTLQRITPTRSK